MTGPRALRTALALLAAALCALGCTRAPRSVEREVVRHPGVVHEVPTDEPLVALTIDDGPDPLATPALLGVLARHRARATFFLLGERAAAHPELARRIVAEGHELGSHGMNDLPSFDLGPTPFERDLLAADRALSAFQPGIRWYRPDSAWYDDGRVEIARRHGYTLVLGSIRPSDAQREGTTFASWWLRADAGPGDVIVLRSGLEAARILDAMLTDLTAKRIRGVTLSELVAARRVR